MPASKLHSSPGREQIDYKQFFKPAQDHYSLRRHRMKLTKERSRLNTRKFFFSQRAVNGWNRLPAAMVNAETVNAFKNAYDRNYKNEERLKILGLTMFET